VTVRPLAAEELALLRALRLRALADAPEAFARTHADLSAQSDAWRADMTRSLTGSGRNVMFVAEDAAAPAGMAFGIVNRERSDTAHLGGMWTDPGQRGRGIGRALGEAVLGWARARGSIRVVRWVTEGNKPTIALYERLGFAPTGRRDRLASNPRLEPLEMERAL
jgi:GNAT superfamily N-acetyltransferase